MLLSCKISQLNSVVLEIELDSHSMGQECLDKVCEHLGIIEVDYFGLQYEGPKGEQLWLNMRNSIGRQLHGRPPYRLQLRVKFYVQPHLLLQDSTRHQFFLNIKQDFCKGHYQVKEEVAAQIIALFAQAEHGDYTSSTSQDTWISIYSAYYWEQLTDEIFNHIMSCHDSLKAIASNTAIYRTLQEISSLENYGMLEHYVRDIAGQKLTIGVSPEGILMYGDSGTVLERILYSTIHKITNSGKCVYLTTEDDLGHLSRKDFILVSKKAACGLYRCITEMHSFYRCDTVRNAVATQYSRDIKGTLASIFNENSQLGKNYMFDIRRTCREVHDHARRVLYKKGNDLHVHTSDDDMDDGDEPSNKEMKVMKKKLLNYEDAILCKICMDNEIRTAFIPCGHLVCCQSCSSEVSDCPLCRSEINQVQQIFLPMWKV